MRLASPDSQVKRTGFQHSGDRGLVQPQGCMMSVQAIQGEYFSFVSFSRQDRTCPEIKCGNKDIKNKVLLSILSHRIVSIKLQLKMTDCLFTPFSAELISLSLCAMLTPLIC